jgi:hypothetical protein
MITFQKDRPRWATWKDQEKSFVKERGMRSNAWLRQMELPERFDPTAGCNRSLFNLGNNANWVRPKRNGNR